MKTATKRKPAARRRSTTPRPGEIRKRRLSAAQAADQWENSTREMARHKALREEAAEVLIPHLARTVSKVYKDRIRLVVTTGNLVLDQEKVRAFLGKRLPKFQKRSKGSKYLQLIDGDEDRDKATG